MKCMACEREARARSDSTQLDDQFLLVGRELQEQCRLRHLGGGGDERVVTGVVSASRSS